MSTAAPLPEALLLDYAAGTASPAIELLMATHLSMSNESRAQFAMMETIGGALLEDLEDEPLERISAAEALDAAGVGEDRQAYDSRRETIAPQQPRPRVGAPPTFNEEELPPPLKTAENLDDGERRWRTLGLGVAATQLSVATNGERAHLLWARGGTGIATHRHVGREVVLVLKGAFWDDGVYFGPGDVAVCEDGTIHTPRIDDGEDCLCLAITEAPVHFTGLPGLILNRFCRF